ncbi:MAG: RluA family pseudouridine synthase [Adlercreutzia sp.]|nr:RluA family pseudouridine synthase [Adlercreutzia sp.]
MRRPGALRFSLGRRARHRGGPRLRERRHGFQKACRGGGGHHRLRGGRRAGVRGGLRRAYRSGYPLRRRGHARALEADRIGLVCHPSVDHAHGTLVNALIWHCGEENLCNVQGEEADRLGIVHRLDRDTSGLMLAAKTDEAGRELMAQIQDRAVDRHYIALVHGIMAHDTGMIDAPIARSADERCRMAVRDVPSAREAITTFRVLERFEAGPKDDGYSLIECKLFTGRTHQIRVHMQYTRHPIVGDPVYNAHGPRDARAQLGLRRQFLHSYSIAFEHPTTGEPMAFADNLPRDLQEALDSLAARSLGKTEAGREVAELMATSPVPSVEGEVPDE